MDIFRKLPAEGRQRYLEKLGDEEKLELAKSEILMVAPRCVETRVRIDTNS